MSATGMTAAASAPVVTHSALRKRAQRHSRGAFAVAPSDAATAGGSRRGPAEGGGAGSAATARAEVSAIANPATALAARAFLVDDRGAMVRSESLSRSKHEPH